MPFSQQQPVGIDTIADEDVCVLQNPVTGNYIAAEGLSRESPAVSKVRVGELCKGFTTWVTSNHQEFDEQVRQ